jgi:hypothetical protein
METRSNRVIEKSASPPPRKKNKYPSRINKTCWILGSLQECFSPHKPVTNGEVLSSVIYGTKVLRKSIKHSIIVARKNAEQFWVSAGIAIMFPSSVQYKILSLHNEYKDLLKDKYNSRPERCGRGLECFRSMHYISRLSHLVA